MICATLGVGAAEPSLVSHHDFAGTCVAFFLSVCWCCGQDDLADGEINVCKGVLSGTGINPKDLMKGVPITTVGAPAGAPKISILEAAAPCKSLGEVWHDKLIR